jgi:hypothetical protein
VSLLALLGQLCAALNDGRDKDALRLVDELTRRTGRHVQITSSSTGLGVSILGRP